MRTNTDFAKYLSRFLSEYLPHERNMSPNTISSYKDTFIQFINFMNVDKGVKIEKLTLSRLTKENVLDFLAWVLEKRKCSIATRNYRLAAIHSFILFLQYEDIVRLEQWQKVLSIKAMKIEVKSINYLSVDAIKLLLEQPDVTTSKGKRDLALLALMYDTGARVQEIIDLSPKSLYMASTPYSIRIVGKGKKSRVIPLMAEQVFILKQYMNDNRLFEQCRTEYPLFFNNHGDRFTRAGITYILKKYLDMARTINKDLIPSVISCHSIRHSKAMHLLQAGVNIIYIRDILGHCSVQTTDIYARIDSKYKNEALEKSYRNTTPECDKDRIWENNDSLLEWLKKFGK